MEIKLFDDMTPIEKIDHIEMAIDDAFRELKAEHGPNRISQYPRRLDYWVPYMLNRLRKLEKVARLADALTDCLAEFCEKTDAACACHEKIDYLGDALAELEKK